MLSSNLSTTGPLLCSDAWEGPLRKVTQPCIWDATKAIIWRYWCKWKSRLTFQATIPTLEHCLSLVKLRLHNITLCRRDMIFYIFQLKWYFSTLELGFTPYLFRTAVKWFVYFFLFNATLRSSRLTFRWAIQEWEKYTRTRNLKVTWQECPLWLENFMYLCSVQLDSNYSYG